MSATMEAILSKYTEEESKINQKETEKKNEKVQKQTEYKKDRRENRIKNMTAAKQRNSQIVKDLEIIKGALRSKAIYSPSEMQWEEVVQRYKDSPSLQITSWRCHLPVFV